MPRGRVRGSKNKTYRPPEGPPKPLMELKVGHKYHFCRKNLDGTIIDDSKIKAFSSTTTKENEMTGEVIAVYPRYYLLAYHGRKLCINKGEASVDYAIAEVEPSRNNYIKA